MFHYAITFLLFYWYQMLYQLENTLKDVINDKCHKCHKCYKSNKCYKILIKYNLSFHNWMLGLHRCWWDMLETNILVDKFLVTDSFFVTNSHFLIISVEQKYSKFNNISILSSISETRRQHCQQHDCHWMVHKDQNIWMSDNLGFLAEVFSSRESHDLTLNFESTWLKPFKNWYNLLII